MENKKCLIIYNPLSGKGKANENISIYYKTLKDKGYDVDIIATKHAKHATEAIIEAKQYDVVFAIGGDGTLNEVVRGNMLRKSKLTICPLPSGTCNDVATMLGYGNNPEQNIEMALSGEEKSMDIGSINDEPFVYVVGMGKFMNIPYETKSEDKKKNGYMAYIKDGLKEVLDKLKRYRAEVTIDGKKLDGAYSLIMVSNSDHVAGVNRFHKDVCLDDGEMEVLLCRAKSKTEFIKSFLLLFLGRQTSDIISLKAHDVQIKLLDKPEKKWCIDGEKFDYNGEEYHISIRDKMKILTPTSNAQKLFKA